MVQSEQAFVCKRCGACCRVPGHVRLSEDDCERLAQALGLSTECFIEAYTTLSPSRSGLILKGAREAPCIFLTAENLCRVHDAAPRQCRDYPTRWRSQAIEAVCAAGRQTP